MKTKKYIFVVLALLLSAYAYFGFSSEEENLQGQEMLRGEVTSVEVSGETQTVKVLITEGSKKGEIISEEEDLEQVLNRRNFEKGDEVMVEYNAEYEHYFISDFVRTDVILMLFALMLFLVFLVARWEGLGSIIGMMLSFLILFKITLPAIISGYDPIKMAIVSALLIVPATFYMSYGLNKKAHVAVTGTLISLFIAGFLAYTFSDLANLTGLATEEASFLKMETANKLNFTGLLLAGMLIGLLGILDDITIAQASVVKELSASNPTLSKKELYKRAMNVGKDHISSMVNTIILIYTGTALPLLLLFFDYSEPFNQIINLEPIAEEIIRTMIGSIGLIIAVPITTFIAILFFKSGKNLPTRR